MEFIKKSILGALSVCVLGSLLFFSSKATQNKSISLDVPAPIKKEIKTPIHLGFFEEALNVVLLHEGGYSDNKADKGGPTKYGISLRLLKDIKYDVDGDGDSDKDDIVHLTRTDADKIYLKNFWLANNFNLLENEAIAIKLMDCSVNLGARRTAILTYQTLNEILVEDLPIGEKFDDKLLDILNNIDDRVFVDVLRLEQAKFYETLIKLNPEFKVFKNGWARRAAS